MKLFLSVLLTLSFFGVFGQNEITTPVGQPLKVGLLNLTSGSLMLNGVRSLSTAGARNIFLGESSGSTTISGADNVFLGYSSGSANTTGNTNVFIGSSSGKDVTSGSWNTFLGAQSGFKTTTGEDNVFIGWNSGVNNTTGKFNLSLGSSAGNWNGTANYNIYLGGRAGFSHKTGDRNIFFGFQSGFYHESGEKNTILGDWAGVNNVNGSGNVFIGYGAGTNELGSNKLYVSNTDTSTPLVYGDFSSGKLIFNGQVAAGTSAFPTSVTLSAADGGGQGNTSAYKLFVKGGILTEQLIIASGWADYVFDKSYKLKPLQEVEKFIKVNGHLPNVPSAGNVEKHGINIGDMTRIQQEKIEELTLYIIELEKKTEVQNQEMKLQGEEIRMLKEQMMKLAQTRK